MAPAQITTPVAPLQSLPHTAPVIAQQPDLDDTNIQTVDALVRHRARVNPHATIVSYPSSGVDFVDYSMQQLDVFAYRVARNYQAFIPMRSSSEEKPATVALLGSSNFDYLVTMLALTKLGHTVLFLSTRISQLAIESLIKTTGACHLIADKKQLQMAAQVRANLPFLHVREIAGSDTFDFSIEVHADTRMDYQLDPAIEALNNIYIIHSSGMLHESAFWGTS
jgi:acyl-CoA synthetase (AMP-forming)/AMP-acid ligase II